MQRIPICFWFLTTAPPDTGMVGIGDLPGGGFYSEGWRINNRGQIITDGRGARLLLTPFVLADMNCDGAVNNFDIDPFVLALTDYAAYEQQYPDCHGDWAGDVNQDGAFDNFDIEPFVECVTNGCP